MTIPALRDRPYAPPLGGARTPWTVHVLGTVTLLLVLVTSYGSYYFSFVFESPTVNAGSWVFLVGFLAINAVAAAAAVGLWRGRRSGHQVLLGYAVLGILWCIAKLIFWHEWESLVFGASNVLALVLLRAPATRRHVGG